MADDGTESAKDVPPEFRSILVQGIDPGTSEELLLLYFENRKKGGGDVESVKLDNNGAEIVFKEAGGKANLNCLEKRTRRGWEQAIPESREFQRKKKEEEGNSVFSIKDMYSGPVWTFLLSPME